MTMYVLLMLCLSAFVGNIEGSTCNARNWRAGKQPQNNSALMCHQRWELIYENSENGTNVFGSKTDLIIELLSGADVRVLVPSSGPGGYLTSIQNIKTIENNICGQALFHVSKSKYDTFQEEAYYWFINLCTTGHVHKTRYLIGSHTSAGIDSEFVRMQWFIRKGEEPIYSHTQDGSLIKGSISDVIYATQLGSDIRIIDCSHGYGVRVDNMEMSQDGSLASGQSLWHVSQQQSGSNLEFQGDDYWLFSIWSTDGRVDISRWNVGEHLSRGNSNVKRSLDWYADSCWQIAYKHDQNGNPQDGSLELLRQAVETGHRIKVLIDGVITVEPDQINVRGGHINAEILSLVSKQDVKRFTDDVYWDWRILTTTGTERAVYYNVGEYFSRGSVVNTKSMTWFIDTRTWNKTFINDADGNTLFGTKQSLIDAILAGAEVRYTLTFGSGVVIHQADNLAISADGNVCAMHVRSVSLMSAPNSVYEMFFQNNPYWWITIASTTGKVDMSRWTVGEHVKRGHSDSNAKVVWYVSY